MKKAYILMVCLSMICSALTACGKGASSSESELNSEHEHSVDSITTTEQLIDYNNSTTNVTTTKAITTSTIANSSRSQRASTTTSMALGSETTTESSLNLVQKNSIAWLNYLALLSQEINSSTNSKMYLEEAYSALINNTNPENVNELTESHLISLLDIMEKYRMIKVKRERLQYIYEQNQAKAMKEAVPNPIGLLSATSTLDPKRLVASVVYMAVDSYSSYTSYKKEIDQGYLKDGWSLNDEEEANLHDSRKRAFQYMIDIVREYDLPGELALNESSIEKFVDCKNNTNTFQQIQFLESNESTYKMFGSYWLLLAECYYKNEEYQKCLDCIAEYESINTGIFRNDHELASTLPIAIAAAKEVQSESKYIEMAEHYLELLVDNTEIHEWDLKYFAATIYSDLYSRTQNKEYLENAYNIVLDNVNTLVQKQEDINQTYLSDVKEISIKKDASKSEKKKIEAYNEALQEKRETELPEIYEPFAINCELLFTIADKLDISQAEKEKIEGILAGKDGSAFLIKPIKNLFSFDPHSFTVDASFDKDELVLPVSCVSEGAKISTIVFSGSDYITYDDWKIDEVNRPDNNKFGKFKVTYTSENAADCVWHKNSIVEVIIDNGSYYNAQPLTLYFQVSDYNKRTIGWDTIEFEQVD